MVDLSRQLRPDLPARQSVAIDQIYRVGDRKPPTRVRAEPGDPKPGMVCRVLVADRDAMTSDLLATALGGERSFDAVAIHPSALLHSLVKCPAAVVVIGADLNCEARSGFDLASAVARAHPECAIVMIVNESTPNTIINAFRSGARGVFSRENPISDFVGCIDHVRKGFIWAGGREAVFLLEALRHIPAPDFIATESIAALTTRELQVVRHAATGKTNKVIASELCLSEHTVKNYLFRAFEKLGVSSRVELLFLLTFRGYENVPNTPDAGPSDESFSA